jgi:beta-fructofuranosidase
LAYGIGHTRHQRRLGSNDDQADSEPGCQTRDGMPVERIEAMIRAQFSSARVPRRGVQLDHGGVATQRQSERVLAPARADHQHPQWTHHGPRAYLSVQARRASLRGAPNQVAFRTVADPSFPSLHIRPSQGWLNDPNGLCRIDGRYHVFFQYNPVSPLHEAISWGHVSSADLIHWQHHPVALTPRPGLIDGGGCWSGCVIDDAGVPTAVYTANPDHARNAVAAVARSDRSLIHWEQDVSPVLGISRASGMDEIRDPFIFVHEGRRYAIQGAGHPLESGRLLLYGCDDLTRWTELGTLLTADDPGAAEAAGANIWECPNLVQMDGHWVLLLSLWRLVDTVHCLAGVRYLLGDLVPQGQGWVFKATSGGVVDDGPAFYAPQVLVEANRTLLWGWAWELGRSIEQIAETGWAGVLTFPRELYLRNGVLGMRPAPELTALRRGRLALEPGQPFQTQAFELLASGPVALRLADDGVDVLVSSAEGTPTEPARILVDGSMVETFHQGASHTTRAYPTANSSWVVDGASVTAYRLGDRGAVAAGAGARPSPGWQPGS